MLSVHRLMLWSLLGAASAVLGAQQTIWQYRGTNSRYNPGYAVVELSDLNQDGCGEWAVQASDVIQVLSGRDGRLLRTVAMPHPLWSVLRLDAAGDVDRDGYLDYACRRCEHFPPWSPEVIEVRSGRNDQIIWSVNRPAAMQYGYQIAGNLDVNGDGRLDLVTTNTFANYAEVFDHRGRLLYRVPGARFAVGAMGDLNGDGCDEFVVSIYNPSTPQNRGGVRVISGRDGRELVRGLGEFPNDRLGVGFAQARGCGDVNGDGVLDFLGSNEGSLGPGSIRIFSGVDGSVIWSWRLPKGRLYGTSIAIGDLDRDGVNDMLVGSSLEPPNTTSGGTVFWYSLRDGREVARIYPPGLPRGQTFLGAYHLAIGAPHPDSPYPVFLVPARGYLPAGRSILMRATPSGVRSLGRPCAGTLEQPPTGSFVTLGDSAVRLHLSGAPAGVPALALIGLSSASYNGVRLPFQLGPLGLPGCSLYTSIDATALMRTGTTGNNRGYASLDVPFGHDPNGSARLFAQWWVAGNGRGLRGAFSEAVSWRF